MRAPSSPRGRQSALGKANAYAFGIEEEYFVNDAAKRDAARGRTLEFCVMPLAEFDKQKIMGQIND